MKRLIAVGALLMALSACGAQTSAISPDNPPFQAIAPAGYCLSDKSDQLAWNFPSRNRPQDWQLLATFHPCGESLEKPGPSEPWHGSRLVFQIRLLPAVGDRQVFVAVMANPKITDLWNARVLPKLRDLIPRAVKGTTVDNLRYLGSDSDAVYGGSELTTRDITVGGTVITRSVFGQTLTGRFGLMVTAMSLSRNNPPEDWDTLQKAAAQAIHSTITIAERPSQAPQPSPPPSNAGALGLPT